MDEELVLKTSSTETYWGFDSLRLRILPYGVTGNTSDFGSEESRFDPWWGNNKHLWPRGEVEVCKTFYTSSNLVGTSKSVTAPKKAPFLFHAYASFMKFA